MTVFPEHTLSFFNLWLFMAIFAGPILISVGLNRHLFIRTSSQLMKNKFSREYKSFLLKKFYMLAYFIYSIFIPIQTNKISGKTGLILYVSGFISYSAAWIVINKAPAGSIFKTGPFAYSRHPVYLSSAVMFLGTGLISNSCFFLVLSIVTGITHLHNAYGEEKRCIEVFGEEYMEYSEKTPRWIGLRR